MPESIWVGMSGGVDSAVAALILSERGCDVTGVTLRLRENSGGDEEDARRVCEALAIPHVILDLSDVFAREVTEPFVREYLSGRTPNPCVRCNRTIKFGAMLDAALAHGADRLATGHYARVEQDAATGRHLLYRTDSSKDQSYFLSRLTQHQLAHAVFPLAGMEKTKIRELAALHNLPVASKSDSMEVCFIPPDIDGHSEYIEQHTSRPLPCGDFIDADGKNLGRHNGIARYTVGQRKGLGISLGQPMYVTKINAADNTVQLGIEGSQFAAGLVASNINCISWDGLPAEPVEITAKIRFRAPDAAATLTPLSHDRAQVDFHAPVRAVSPGQTVVFYDGDAVIGGGIIE